MRSIELNRYLEIIPPNKVRIPGCEPVSTITSTEMAKQIREQGLCTASLIDLEDALKAIPNAEVVMVTNFGPPRRMLLKLPSEGTNCPCQSIEDWYNLLRNSVSAESPDFECDSGCGETVNQGFCF